MRGVVRWVGARARAHLFSLAGVGLLPPSAIAASGRVSLWRHGRSLYALAGFVALVAAIALRLAPPPHGLVAVMFPPWVSAEEAEERIVRAGGLPVVDADARLTTLAIAATPQFHRALRRQGALLILDGDRVRRTEAMLEKNF